MTLDYVSNEVKEHLIKKAKDYDFCKEFADEVGWEDWMNELTESEDDLSERENDLINSILEEAFNEAHKEPEMKATKKQLEYAEMLVKSFAWDGEKNMFELAKMYSEQELADMVGYIDEAEDEYLEYLNMASNELKTDKIFIKIEPSLKKIAEQRAAEEGRTLSRYIAELIKKDAEKLGAKSNTKHDVFNSKKKYYFPNDDYYDKFFGNSEPICVDFREIQRLAKEWGLSYRQLMLHVHTATEEEKKTYGLYAD